MQMMNFSMEELLPVVTWLSEKYTSKESTSLTYERARQLMEAVIYCISQYEDDNQVVSKNGIAAKEIYQAGYERLIRKVQHTQMVYSDMIENFHAYGNENYYDIVTKAIPAFFQYYDARFAPQETIITMDYPTICPITDSSGIEKIAKYVEYISYEQKFLGALPEEYVLQVLTRYQVSYRKQFYNICRVIFRHMIGHMLLEKKLGEWGEKKDYEKLQQIIVGCDKERIEGILTKLLERLIQEKFYGDKELGKYLLGDIQEFATELLEMVKWDGIKKIIVL